MIVPDLDYNVIEKWKAFDRRNSQNRILKGGSDFLGPSRNRVCTDLLCLSLSIVLNFALIGTAYYIFLLGDINRLGHGSDFRGEVCGVSGLSERPYTYFPKPKDPTIVLCLSSCPTSINPSSICYYDTDHKTDLTVWGCWDSIPCTKISSFCIPGQAPERKFIIDEYFTQQNLITQAGGDIISTWEIIALGTVFSLIYSIVFVCAFPYSNFIKKFSIFCICQNSVLLFCLSGLIYYNSYLTNQNLCEKNNEVDPDYCYSEPENELKGFSYTMIVFSFIYLAWILFHRHDIHKSTQILKITSDPIVKVKGIMSIPILLLIIGIVFISALYLLVLWTFGIGEVVLLKNPDVPGGSVSSLEYRSQDKTILVFILLMCFWWLYFLSAISSFIIGGVVGSWYFTKEKSSLFHPLKNSVKNCFRYHLGSISRSSITNLLFEHLTALLSSVNSLLVSHHNHKCAIYTAYLLCPCLSLFNSFLKFTTSLTSIYISIFALPYSQSSQQSFYLIQRNSQRWASPLRSSRFLIKQIKLSIVLSGTLFVYAYLSFVESTLLGTETKKLSSFIAPSVFGMFFCIFMAEITGNSYYAAVQAVVLCSVLDEEMFSGEQKFMKEEMQEVLEVGTVETRRIMEYGKIEVQMPGRSERLPLNLLQFDENMNPKLPQKDLSRFKKSQEIRVSDMDHSK